MRIGKQGEFGFPGATGVTGPTGPTGFSPIGETGISGDIGVTGEQGPTGQQITGANGENGATGADGDPTKMAIVPSLIGPVALYCVEAPEVWFKDIQVYEVSRLCSVFPLDPIFASVCTDIQVTACVCNRAVLYSVTLWANQIQIFHSSQDILKFTISIRGKRIGFSNRRFFSHTEAERITNNLFWAQA